MYDRKELTAALICLALLFSVFLVGSASGGNTKAMNKTLDLTKTANGGKFRINTGASVHIWLGGNGATGYAWYFDNMDTEHFELLKDNSTSSSPVDNNAKQENTAVGAPTLSSWRLKAKKKGRSELKLLYYRIWEGATSAVDTFSVQIDIE